MSSFYMFLISLVFAYYQMLLDLHRSSHDIDICLGRHLSWETYLIFASSALARMMPQVAFSGLLGKSLKRQQFWDDSHRDHVSARLKRKKKKGTRKQLPMLSKPRLSNVPFRCLHHHTWKGGGGVTFGQMTTSLWWLSLKQHAGGW